MAQEQATVAIRPGAINPAYFYGNSACAAGRAIPKEKPGALSCEGEEMRYPACLFLLILLVACASRSSGSATLVLRDPYWEHVNVEAVITRSSDCSRREDYLSTDKFALTKGQTHAVEAPHAENICWRHDRNPDSPAPGQWSDWSRATMFPGQTAETDL